MSNKLKEYIKDNNVDCEHLEFKESCHSVQEAANAANALPQNFIKSICMISKDPPNNKPIIAIVKGEDRASTSRVSKALNIQRPDIASPEQILEFTGYPCGGTPPFGYSAIFLIDEKVMEKEFIYGGGGSENSLVKISSKELVKINNGTIARIRK